MAARKATKKDTPKEVYDGCCGSCYWFVQSEDIDWGWCFEAPPVAGYGDDGTLVAIEPPVEVNRHHCSKYRRSYSQN